MKALFALSVMCLTVAPFNQQQKKEDLGLPELHKIKTATLSPSYSCRSKQDSRRGYEKTALFLSTYADDRNGPELLFNGACGSQDYFQGSTAGDDMSLIADLGTIPLENATSHFIMSNQDKDREFFRFASEAK